MLSLKLNGCRGDSNILYFYEIESSENTSTSLKKSYKQTKTYPTQERSSNRASMNKPKNLDNKSKGYELCGIF
jgi:hypothetical protein